MSERNASDEIEHYGKHCLDTTCRAHQWHSALLKLDVGTDDKINERKLWEQTELTVRLAVSYYPWIWRHSCLGTTAAQRAELTDRPWTWNDIATYPTLV